MNEILESLGEEDEHQRDVVIYGLTDRSHLPFWVRLNDAWIDRQRVPLKEKSYFFHLMAVMLDAGIPMLSALQLLAKKTTHERFRRVISTLAHNVEAGRPLSDAMSKFPMVFDEAELGVIKSGEAIGRLDEMLARLSAQVERTHEVHMKLRGAMTYPIVVVVVLFVATLVVMTLVIPQLKQFFAQSGVELPWLTRMVVGSSSLFLSYWWAFVLGSLLAFVLASMYGNTRGGQIRFDYWKLKLPIIGGLIQKAIVAKFVRMLGVLASSGLPINQSLAILGESMDHSLYEMKLKEVVVKVERGEKISASLATTPFLFPNTVTQMLSIGESSATLDQAAEKLADHYEREIGHSIKNLTTILEPLVIVFVGAAVGVLALAILGPVFSLSELV